MVYLDNAEQMQGQWKRHLGRFALNENLTVKQDVSHLERRLWDACDKTDPSFELYKGAVSAAIFNVCEDDVAAMINGQTCSQVRCIVSLRHAMGMVWFGVHHVCLRALVLGR